MAGEAVVVDGQPERWQHAAPPMVATFSCFCRLPLSFRAAFLRASCLFLLIGQWGVAQDATEEPARLILKAEAVEDVEADLAKEKAEMEEKKEVSPLDATWKTQTQARVLTLSIPAPRGQIVDRNGVPLAQTRVAHALALNFPFMKDATKEQILEYANGRIDQANRLLGKEWGLPDERLLEHYEHRRWLPLVFSIEEGLSVDLSVDEMDKVQGILGSGLELQPSYVRYYPKGDTACHVVGYVGKVRQLPTGPIADGDPLFEQLEGREGLELTFNSDLEGTPGSINMLFSPEGKLLSEEILRRPVPGRTLVLSLDFNFQKYSENALKKGARNGGSFVIMDVRTGDILAMASNPGYDLNLWVPGIKSADFQKLNQDPKKPLYPRASFGQYPPASTFKIVTALGALESGKVTERTSYDCDNAYYIGDRYFKNWNKNGEGSMNVITAIKRSCNTWFYQAALAVGTDAVTDMALRMGFGEKTGIPLRAEAAGTVPTNASKMASRGYKILGGELANIAIGQGEVLVTPLQVCRSMAALADGVTMPKPRLVRQVQDVNNRVVMATDVEVARRVDLNPEHREAVVKGMVAVVSGDGGTGRRAGIEHAQVAGKTGTAQWKIAEDQNLAWFTGFLPANNPVYAFAVLYEGSPGESVSGGALAAPMVSEVFNNIFEKASPDDPLVLAMQDIPKAVEVDEGDSDPTEGGQSGPSETQYVEPPPVEETEKRTLGGFFRRIFGN